jgi:serine/threonine protein kinase
MRCRHKNLYDAKSALRWASQVASALAALHEQQPAYVHNDVKADNVFLTDQPSIFSPRDAKLGDLKPHRCVAVCSPAIDVLGVSLLCIA